MSNDKRYSLLIGIHSVEAALDSRPQQVRRVILAEEVKNPRTLALQQKAHGLGLVIETRARAQLDRLSDGQRHVLSVQSLHHCLEVLSR